MRHVTQIYQNAQFNRQIANWKPKCQDLVTARRGRKYPPRAESKSLGHQGKASLSPFPNATIHAEGVDVAHFLKVVGRQRRAEATAAIQDNLGGSVGEPLFNV